MRIHNMEQYIIIYTQTQTQTCAYSHGTAFISHYTFYFFVSANMQVPFRTTNATTRSKVTRIFLCRCLVVANLCCCCHTCIRISILVWKIAECGAKLIFGLPFTVGISYRKALNEMKVIQNKRTSISGEKKYSENNLCLINHLCGLCENV